MANSLHLWHIALAEKHHSTDAVQLRQYEEELSKCEAERALLVAQVTL